MKPRSVPFAIKQAIEEELKRLEAAGIIEKVPHSKWAAPIVPVPKGDGKIRLCGDYKVTVNQSLEIDQYPLPKPEDLFASLAGGEKFSKIDLTQAYLQMLLEEESRGYVTVNTHMGLYRYTRLPFGISSAPAIFQRTMDTILQGLNHVQCYIDDILVTGADDEEHLRNLEEVLARLFSCYGLPEQLVSDNGPQFVSEELRSFLKRNGVKHIRCAPYHPSSNGAAERFIQTFKRAMQAQKAESAFQQRLMSFLLTYRITPHTTTNVAPCTLFLKREVRTRFDLMRPDISGKVATKQAQQKFYHDQHTRTRELFIGQRVMVRNLRPGDK